MAENYAHRYFVADSMSFNNERFLTAEERDGSIREVTSRLLRWNGSGMGVSKGVSWLKRVRVITSKLKYFSLFCELVPVSKIELFYSALKRTSRYFTKKNEKGRKLTNFFSCPLG